LIGLIKDSVKVELSELRYEKHYNQIFNVLLLFNVETNRITDSISEYYPFKQHKGKQWSLEHIHARKSEFFDENKKEPWLKVVRVCIRQCLEEKVNTVTQEDQKKLIDTRHPEKIHTCGNDQLRWERFTNIFKEVNDLFTSRFGKSGQEIVRELQILPF
jgi:hypothetical protein